MKLNLLMNESDIRAGYENIDGFPGVPVNQEFSEVKIIGDVINLDWYCENNTCEEIIAINILNNLFIPQVHSTLENWYQKLQNNGKLILSTIDLYEVGKNLSNGLISFNEALTLLYGTQQSGIWDLKKNAFTMDSIIGILKALGFTIKKVKSNNYKLVIECIKNETGRNNSSI